MTDERDGQNVYILEHEHGFVKIGVSNNPVRRVSDLETACPYDIRVLGVIETDEPFVVESTLHNKYDRKQKKGEWYNLTTEDRAHLLAVCDLSPAEVNRRYAVTEEKRRELTLTMQGLVG